MRIGQLRHRVTIEEPSTTLDEYGQPVPDSFTSMGQRWASVEPLTASEAVSQQQQQSSVTHKVTLRYFGGLSEKHRLIFNGRKLNVVSVLSTGERGEEMVVLCEEVTDG